MARFLSRRIGLFKFCYLLVALVYAGIAVYWGRYDLARVNREYRRAAVRLTSGYAMRRAGQEVEKGCREAVGEVGPAALAECLRKAQDLIPPRVEVINRQLQLEKRQATRKLVIFYALLVFVLILFPVAVVYGLLAVFLGVIFGVRFRNDDGRE